MALGDKTFDYQKVEIHLNDIKDGITDAKFMRRLGMDSVADILHRVQQEGKGSDDQPMKPYSAAYAKRRSSGFDRKGVGRGGHGPGRKKSIYQVKMRDLTVTGQMLAAMNVIRAGGKSVTIGFVSEQEELKARGNEAKTPWFGLTEGEQKKALERVQNHINGLVG